MKNEKTYLIGKQALTIEKLEREYELLKRKINQLWLDDFIPSKISWEMDKEEKTCEDFETFLESFEGEIKEKESNK